MTNPCQFATGFATKVTFAGQFWSFDFSLFVFTLFVLVQCLCWMERRGISRKHTLLIRGHLCHSTVAPSLKNGALPLADPLLVVPLGLWLYISVKPHFQKWISLKAIEEPLEEVVQPHHLTPCYCSLNSWLGVSLCFAPDHIAAEAQLYVVTLRVIGTSETLNPC